jgi:hypothetical protein
MNYCAMSGALILDPSRDGYDYTVAEDPGAPGSVEYLFESPIVHPINRGARFHHHLLAHRPIGRSWVGQIEMSGASDG